MVGYIYRTTNLLTGDIYIGRCVSEVFKPNYLGSGRNIKQAVKDFGRQNFVVEMIDKSDNYNELDALERYYINQYMEDIGDHCYNILQHNSPSKPAKKFVERMTQLNRERSLFDQYRLKHSASTASVGYRCHVIIHQQIHNFETKKACEEYLYQNYGFVPSNLSQYTKDNPYSSPIKYRSKLNGLIFGYGTFQRKSVTTNPDECKGVGVV